MYQGFKNIKVYLTGKSSSYKSTINNYQMSNQFRFKICSFKSVIFLILPAVYILILFTAGCEKDESSPIELPTVITLSVTEIEVNSAKSGGNIIDDGGAEITSRGIVWCENPEPTIEQHKGISVHGNGLGLYISEVTGLSYYELYYIRAFAKNKAGISYGNELKFITGYGIYTADVINITVTTASSGGVVPNNSDLPLGTFGIVWSLSDNPTLENNDGITYDGENFGDFSSNMTGLSPETLYYARAYSTNADNTVYGNIVKFETLAIETDEEPGTITDIDGNSYQIATINNRKWIAENIRTTRFNNGDYIKHAGDHDNWISAGEEETGAWCWYDNDSNNELLYGKLYNWYVVNDERNICPEGWSVPTIEEWNEMVSYLGEYQVAGGKLKSTRTEPDPHPRWDIPNTGATNESKYSGLPGGARWQCYGVYYYAYRGTNGFWWTSSEYQETAAWSTMLTFYEHGNHSFIGRSFKRLGFSVRCIKNQN